ncbi:glycogen synthase [Rubritalea halochordaticola]|uniref:Glycogen synthase n=1 Tax=Rubritalea halochordaticola TaxID=714537 RepID=A0ABP9UYQ1_9BACT
MLPQPDSYPSVIHLCWEFPPRLEGGLGQACAGLVSALKDSLWVNVFSPDEGGHVYEPLISQGVIKRGGANIGTYQNSYANVGDLRGMKDMESFYRAFLSGDPLGLDPFLEQVLRFNRSVINRPVSDVQVVHAHDWLSILAGVCLKRHYGCRLVWHVHSLQSDRVGYHDHGLIYHLEKWGAEQADCIVAVSHYTKRVLCETYEASPEKVRVVHNGIETERGQVTPFGSRKKVLFLGRMTGQKAPEFMVEVARELLRHEPAAHIILAGEGERLPVLREVVNFRKLQGSIHFVGRVHPDRVRGLLENVDVLCLPSLSEPFGLVALEAAMAGVAVVMSDRCGASEVLSSARVVRELHHYEWAGAIQEIFAQDESGEIRLQVQKEAASRSWHDAAGEMMKIYTDLVS